MEFSRSAYLSLPAKSGVYVLQNDKGAVLYVGKAKDLKSRVSSYFANPDLLVGKTKTMVQQVEKIKITIVESELEALLLEAFYIKKYKPKYNIRLTDGKSYILIRISGCHAELVSASHKPKQRIPNQVRDDTETIVFTDYYPKVLLARRADDKNSLYFGPYPSSGAVRTVLKTIRRIFPYQSVLNHPKRVCLYHHLGLCPCPIVFDSPELKKEYRKNIRGIIRMLEGESQKIMKELEKERNDASKDERFEDALKLQKKINALSLITTPFHQAFEYDVNPNLRTDIRKQELDELRNVLNKAYAKQIVILNEVKDLKDSSVKPQNDKRQWITNLDRIECYDISNMQGTNATGSMVVLTHGEIDKSQYRKFKIRRDWEKQNKKDVILEGATRPIGSRGGDSIVLSGLQNDKKHLANDFAMMKEVLKRRFGHDEWNTPSLIVIDGGKGQVSSALEALSQRGMSIPLIGLAKREETIVIPNFSHRHSGEEGRRLQNPSIAAARDSGRARMTENRDNFIEILLPKNSKSLQLIMRIRDEAHRFAVTYHKKLRSKATFV